MSACLPDSIRASLPYLLARAHQRQLELFDQHTAAFAIGGREYAVMRLLETQPGLWQSQIAEALNLDRTTVTHLVDSLEKRGWAARGRDPEDRRAHVIALTEAGRNGLTEIQPAAVQAMSELLSPLSEAEQEQLRTLLIRLMEKTP